MALVFSKGDACSVYSVQTILHGPLCCVALDALIEDCLVLCC